jgi:hypothetical protein
MDKRLTCRAAGEGIDHIGVSDIGELIALHRAALNVLPEGLIVPPCNYAGPMSSRLSVRTLEVPNEG